MPVGLRQDERSRDRQGAVSPPQESGPATSLRPTQGDENGWFSTERSRDCRMIYREFA